MSKVSYWLVLHGKDGMPEKLSIVGVRGFPEQWPTTLRKLEGLALGGTDLLSSHMEQLWRLEAVFSLKTKLINEREDGHGG